MKQNYTFTIFECFKNIRQNACKNKYALLLLVSLIGIFQGYGQTVTLGTGTNATAATDAGPVNQFYKYMHFQVVYTAAELIAAGAPSGGGNISSFGWNVSTAPNNIIPSYSVRMAHTTATNSVSHNTASLTTVYGATNTTFATGYNMLTLSGAGFNWDGTSNLLIDICNSSAATYASNYGQIYTYGSALNSSRYDRSDVSNQCSVTTSTTISWKPQARFVFTALVACSGTPSPGNTLATTNPVAAGSSTNLSLQNATNGSGVTYQWQSSSTSTGPWSSISGATASTYTATPTNKTWYRCVVTCSGSSGNSAPIEVSLTPCVSNPTSNDNSGITNVIVGSANFSVADVTYYNYTAIVPNLTPGSTITSSITFATGYTYDSHIWIDFNDDAVFDNATEKVYTGMSLATNPTTLNTTFALSGTATLGTHKMRIGTADSGQSTPTPCYSGNYGVTVDLMVNIVAAVPCSGTPTGGTVTVSPTTGSPGSTYGVTATGYTTGTGLTYQWQFSNTGNAPWTNQGNATSSYAALSGQIAPAFGVVKTWRLVVTCTPSGFSANSITGTFTSGYCTPAMATISAGGDYIGNVTFAGINNTTGDSATDYTYYNPTPAASVLANSTYPISLMAGGTSSLYAQQFGVWIDYNQNGSFADAGEFVFATSVATFSPTTSTGNITIPAISATVLAGTTRMRVMSQYNPAIVASNSCFGSSTYGEYEDYNITITAPAPCATPTAQPTALSLSVAGTTINGSFTAASPAPNNYLVVVSTSATPPTPANGTTYSIGGTVGAGYNVVDTDGNTTFSATGLSPSTLYYIYVFSYNAACTGGPLYYTTSPLSASATTLMAIYCEPTSWNPEGLYIDKVAFVGAITDPPVNISTYGTSGFQNFTGLPNKAVQAQGEGINVIASSQGNILSRGSWKAWVDWNNNGTFEPATEEVYNILGFAGSDATFGFVIPLTTIPGDYRIRIRVNNGIDTWDYSETFGFNFSPCDPFEYIAPYDLWIEDYGETEDYLFTVVAKCNSLITEVTDGSRCGNGTVALGAKATAGVTQFRWYTAAVGGSYSTSVPAGIATTFTTPSLSATTNYYVTSWNGSCESQVRTLVTAKINPTAVVAFTPATPIVCGDDAILQLTAGGDKEVIYLVNEDFESGSLGVFENINNDSNNGTIKANTSWKNITSTYVPSTTNVWFPAISSGFGTNKFALAYSDSDPYPTSTIENSITLINSVSTNTFLNLTLKLKLYYSRYYPDGVTYPSNDEYVNIELSTDGGSTYPVVLQSFITDIGIGTKFSELSYNLSAYINQPTLKIRIRHRSFAGGGWLPDGVAIDDIELFGDKPLNTAFNYNTAIVSAFTDAAALIPYVSGTLANTIFIRPTTTQLENTSFSIPVAATLSNGCSATGSVVIVNNTKMFVAGTPDADWNTASNWRPSGVPTASNCVVIFDNDVNITNPSFNALAQSLTIKPTGNLNLGTGRSLTVTDVVKVETNGVFELENNSSLVQKNNVPNSGKVTYRRIANIRKLDYVYWSSPLTSLSNFSSATISTGTPANAIYKWTPTIGSNINGFGNWASGVENMVSGKGYLVRGPDSFGTTAAPLLAEFKGTPANGSFTTPIARGAYNGSDYNTLVSSTLGTKDDDNWNLIGNPYPSAIKAIDFLTLNTNIDGFVQIWTHGTSPSTTIVDPFYDNFVYNYSVGDYITYNKTGTSTGPSVGGPYPYDGFIPAGQGFFVLMNHTAPTPATVTFMNTMRSSAHNNSQFFRNATDVVNDESEGRIWLDLIAANGDNIRTLVGYIEEATNERDRLFDAIADRKVNLDLYSTIGEDQMRIQGRMLPFDDSDRVPLGMKVPQDGTYSIAIAFVEGLFAHDGQNIYLKDIQNGVIHDLSAGPYHFNAATGEQNDRFEIVYRDGTLAADDFAQTETIKVMVKNEVSIVSSETMQEVVVYNVVGQILDRYSNIAANTITLTTLQQTQKTLLLKIKLNNGKTVTRKIMF